MNALGDFQTPPELAAAVVDACRRLGFAPARILEPTCGSGAFLRAAATAFPGAEIIGIEFQRERYGAALAALVQTIARLDVVYADAYALDVRTLPWRSDGPLLIVGNPPWVTAAALGRVPGALQPPRSNFKGLRGLAARTGTANFDVAEFLVLKLLSDLRGQAVDLALLVKESVARNLIDVVARRDFGVTFAEIVRIDARASFGVSVDACCLLMRAEPGGTLRTPCIVRPDFFGGPATQIVPTPARLTRTGGASVFRQGIKHDAAAVFELRLFPDGWRNGYAERVDVEAEFVYPLCKARALHSGRFEPTAVIVPQRRLGESTAALEQRAPRLWRYLGLHADRIAARKSSIYRGAPPFAMFGIGPYSFAPWKVAVAGFYPEPRFRVLGPQAGRPVMLGDTAYFAGFTSEAEARAFGALCASPSIMKRVRERIVRGKRPITKALLDSIDWAAGAVEVAAAPDRLVDVVRETIAS